MREVNVGIVGLGNVGSGTLAILAGNADQIALKLGFRLKVTAVCCRTVAARRIPESSMTHCNDRLRCAVDVVGISNWITFLEHTEAYRRDLRRVEYGDERDPEMHAFLESISPIAHVGNITKPMFIVAGRNDPRVPYTEGQQMTAAIRAHGVPVWYLLAADEGHGFAKKGNRDFQFAATVMFIRKYLME